MRSIQHAAVEALPERFMEVIKKGVSELSEQIEEIVLVACRDGNEAVVVHHVEGHRPLRAVQPDDARLPMHATAVGKVLLIGKDEEDIRRLLGEEDLASFTSNTKTGINSLLQSLQEIREQGYAVEDEEYQLGIQALAVPVLSCNRIVAAVSVLIPAAHAQDGAVGTLLEQLKVCANTISEQL